MQLNNYDSNERSCNSKYLENYGRYPYERYDEEMMMIMGGMTFPMINEEETGYEMYGWDKIRIGSFEPLKIPIKTLKDNSYVYVNSKQYSRIMKRREKRINIINSYKEENSSGTPLNAKPKGYHHESRHQHAMKRMRGTGGRFLSKQTQLPNSANAHSIILNEASSSIIKDNQA